MVSRWLELILGLAGPLLGLTAAAIAGIYVNRGGAKDHRALPTIEFRRRRLTAI